MVMKLTPPERFLQDLRREANELAAQIQQAEARLAKIRALIPGVKELIGDATPRSLTHTVRVSGSLEQQDLPNESLLGGNGHRRGNTTKLVLGAIRANPGISAREIVLAVRADLTSPA